MSDLENDPTQEEIPEAIVVESRGLSWIWAVPVVAALVAGSLLYDTFERDGKTIEISFEEASGLAAGKTEVRYREVTIGTVKTVRLSDDLTHTVVEAQIDRSGERVLVEGTRFWVERPRIGPQGISGLTTLVSGAYIALDPGTLGGPPKHQFEGLSDPPEQLKDDKGLHLVLRSKSGAAGLIYGSPVLHEGLEVGRITGLDLARSGPGIEVRVSIKEAYAGRVHDHTRFWNESGVDAHAGFDGIEVDIASLETVLTGAIVFSTPGEPGERARNGHAYRLFDNRTAALKDHADSLGLHVSLLTDQLGSVAEGDPILYRGVAVGRVLGHELEEGSQRVVLRLQIDAHYAPLVRSNSVFWNASGIDSDFGLTGLHVHVASLKSLLSGAIEFATPDPPGPEAGDGMRFELASKRKDKWTKWSPEIRLPPEQGETRPD